MIYVKELSLKDISPEAPPMIVWRARKIQMNKTKWYNFTRSMVKNLYDEVSKMKKMFVVLTLIAVLAVSVFATKEEEVEIVFYTDVTPQEAELLIEENVENEHFIILDVRTPSEYNAGHIDGATNVNYNASDFVERLNKLDKTDMYLLYCASGNRSSRALKKMKELNFTKIYHLKKGYSGWKRR